MRLSWVNSPGSIFDKVNISLGKKIKYVKTKSLYYLHDIKNIDSWPLVKVPQPI